MLSDGAALTAVGMGRAGYGFDALLNQGGGTVEWGTADLFPQYGMPSLQRNHQSPHPRRGKSSLHMQGVAARRFSPLQ